MRYYVAGLSIALMIVGGALIGAGVAVVSQPLILGGVIAVLVSGMVGIFARSR